MWLAVVVAGLQTGSFAFRFQRGISLRPDLYCANALAFNNTFRRTSLGELPSALTATTISTGLTLFNSALLISGVAISTLTAVSFSAGNRKRPAPLITFHPFGAVTVTSTS